MATKLYSLRFALLVAPIFLLPNVVLAQAATAKVVLYRPSKLFSFGINYGIYHEGQELCRLSNRRYLVTTVPAGIVTLRSHVVGYGFIKRERVLRFPAQAGETYYVQANPLYFADALDMAVVPADYAKDRLRRITKPDHCSEPLSLNQ